MHVVKHDKRLMTVEELWELPEKPGVNFELVKGVPIEMPGTGGLHALIVGAVYEVLSTFVREHDLGAVFGDNTAYVLARNPDLLRIPDVSFVSWERLPEEGVPEGFLPGAPDLAVEVVSPNDRAEDVHDKILEYLEAGSQLVWVLWPVRRSVAVHDQSGLTRELGPEDELDGGEVLPGFSVRVSKLFDVRRRR